MIEFKLYHTNNKEYHRFSYHIITNAEEYKILLKKIISKCQIKNKSKLEYLDNENDKIIIKSFEDIETMFRLRLLGQPIRLFITELNSSSSIIQTPLTIPTIPME